MQLEKEVIITSEEDEDLFGTPPPSPGRGRSPSPGLALPNSTSGVSLVSQNVGTIALPGSQHNAELAVNPLALPSSDSRQGSPRPPANMNASSDSSRLSPMSSVGTSSRSCSQTPFISKSRKRKNRTSGSSSRPPPLEIPLPDPSQPIPSNWLRSQTALLGHAGLVGGVKPANLSHGIHRGSTPANPIVVDDTNGTAITPKLSAKSKTPRRLHHSAPFANLDLPPPPIRDIVDILIKQKEVFPVLQDLLKLFSGNPGLAYRALNGPPQKRRKLNRVPAGAVDWDVPYPFQEGEGPQSYHDGWAQDRAKQLVSQLVSLIKTASRKAALRNYLQGQNQLIEHLEEKRRQSEYVAAALKDSEHSEPKIHGHYRPATRFYGIDKSNVPDTIKDIPTHSPPGTAHPSSSLPAITPQSTSCIEDLISSLVTTAPISQSNVGTGRDSSASSNHVPQQTNDIDGVTDNWMALFQSIIPNQNQDILFSMTTNQGDGLSATSDIPMDFDLSTFPESSSATASAMSAFAPSFLDSPQSMDVDNSVSEASTTMPDIDTLFGHSFTDPLHPDSLAVSIPHMSASGTPSLAASPIPSSFGGDFPMTPLSGFGSELNANGNLDFDFDLGSITSPQGGVVDDVLNLNAASSLMALGGNANGPWSAPSDGLDYLEEVNSVDGNGVNVNASNAKQTEFRKEKEKDAVNARMDISQGQGDNTPPLSTSGINDGILTASEDQADDTEQDVETVKDVIPMLMSAVLPMGIPLQTHNVNIGTSSVFTPPAPVMANSPLRKTMDISELLRLARERRAKLAEEIIKTRTQLWETTIEHGVLMHLSKFYP